MNVAQMLFSPLFFLLTDRQTKGKTSKALPRGCPPQRGDAERSGAWLVFPALSTLSVSR